VISIVGRRIGRALRGKDCIGRFSSNKFGVVLNDCDGVGAETIAQRLMASVRDSVIDTSVGAVATTISVGGVLLPEHAGNAQAAIGRALRALEMARNSRSERFNLYRPCERRDSERRRAVGIADEIVRALNDRRMILALQPIVTSRSHEPELYKCLLRMKRLDGTIACAAEFIHVAEQFGLAKLIDHRVLELAVDLLRSSAHHQACAQRLCGDGHRCPVACVSRSLQRQGPDAHPTADGGDHRDRSHLRSGRDR
jgi:predicted signal transduction protein with EAL and GGDEF domain